MKRLLLGPALALPLILGLCQLRAPELPKVPEVVREIPLDDFKQFPPITTTPTPEPPRAAPVHPRPHVRPTARTLGHKRPAAPSSVAKEVPDQQLPPQQGPICIFPFNMIPNCTPQVAGQ
jgi:hypothetical protein